MNYSKMIMINIIIVQKRMFFLFGALTALLAGCTSVPGNYPSTDSFDRASSIRLVEDGFQLIAGSRLELDRIQADLGLLRSQGFSPHDPQILRSVAHREKVPLSLLGDGSNTEYYRVRFRVHPGTRLQIRPGAITLTLKTDTGLTTVKDLGYLVEDHRIPGGCLPPSDTGLELNGGRSEVSVLVRAGLRGKIVGLTIDPHLTRVLQPD
jgi:hypothetical protein